MYDLVLLEHHERALKGILRLETGREAAAYVAFGKARIVADPWTGVARTRLISHKVWPVAREDKISASSRHVTWSTRGFVQYLAQTTDEGLTLGIVHSHPGGSATFSSQDDRNEAELSRSVTNRNGPMHPLVSLLIGGDGGLAARVWTDGLWSPVNRIAVTGRRLRFYGTASGEQGIDFLERQARLFGAEANSVLHSLRVAVVGCGGTGSPVAQLLLRLGVGQLLLIDSDTIEVTNLNRVHGARRADIGMPKVDVLAREIQAAGLSTNVVAMRAWAGAPKAREALRACDVIFGCTDDHDGRALLNRLAYFYGIPLLDVGLRMRPAVGPAPFHLLARLSLLAPGSSCLLCRNVISPARAAEEHLERANPAEFTRRKAEAYVEGGGDPAPAVVTFTTEAATMAVNELLQAITTFRGGDGMASGRFRHFEIPSDRTVAIAPRVGCPVCDRDDWWGRGDVEPFLYRSG